VVDPLSSLAVLRSRIPGEGQKRTERRRRRRLVMAGMEPVVSHAVAYADGN
jgi:hypothetical protein